MRYDSSRTIRLQFFLKTCKDSFKTKVLSSWIRKTIVISCVAGLFGCDRAHEAYVRVSTEVLKSSITVTAGQTPGEAIKTAVENFSKEIKFTCREPGAGGAIIECGPSWHRSITLQKQGDVYEVNYLEVHPGWGNSPYFCSIQSEMFSFFSSRFEKKNIELTTNDPCGRIDYPSPPSQSDTQKQPAPVSTPSVGDHLPEVLLPSSQPP
ncbi:MAG: hypothetical protein MPW17_06855 [Candidatus Manganitrophus sp.]|nr:MAG: hypothetical protein MPW17_06855 [Candidatus Manganitrophus sp.]